LTFAPNQQNSMRDCSLLCYFSAFLVTASMQNIEIACVSLHLWAYLIGGKTTFGTMSSKYSHNLQCFEPQTKPHKKETLNRLPKKKLQKL